MASFKSVRKRCQHLNARDMRGLVGVSNGVFWHGVFSSFRAGVSSFRAAGFVFSSLRVALFRLVVFTHGVFRLFRLFVFSNGVFSSFRLFAWRLFAARGRKDEMAQTGHHIYVLLLTRFHHVHVSLLFLLFRHMSVMT